MHWSHSSLRARSSRSCSCSWPRGSTALPTSPSPSSLLPSASSGRSCSCASSAIAGCDRRHPDRPGRGDRARLLPRAARDAERDRPPPLRGRSHDRRPRADRRGGVRRGGALHRKRAERDRGRRHARAARRGAHHRDGAGDPAARPRDARVEPGRAGARRLIPLQAAVIGLVAAGALAVVLTRDLVRLAMASSLYALLLVVLFLVLQAPDVALSELVVGAIAFPLVIAVSIVLERGG